MGYFTAFMSILGAIGALLIVHETGYGINLYDPPLTLSQYVNCMGSPFLCRPRKVVNHGVNSSSHNPTVVEVEPPMSSDESLKVDETHTTKREDIYTIANVTETPAFIYLPGPHTPRHFETFSTITGILVRHLSHTVHTAFTKLRAAIDWPMLVKHFFRT
ncbi:MAG: hypothetical protein M1835_003761, partial [Candelina submexicana]